MKWEAIERSIYISAALVCSSAYCFFSPQSFAVITLVFSRWRFMRMFGCFRSTDEVRFPISNPFNCSWLLPIEQRCVGGNDSNHIFRDRQGQWRELIASPWFRGREGGRLLTLERPLPCVRGEEFSQNFNAMRRSSQIPSRSNVSYIPKRQMSSRSETRISTEAARLKRYIQLLKD